MTRTLSSFVKDCIKWELYIEPYEFPEDVEIRQTWGIITKGYEIGCAKSTGEFYHSITHATHDLPRHHDAFRFEPAEGDSAEIRYTTILSEHEYDEDGNLVDVELPEEQYDQGSFGLEEGAYHVWDNGGEFV